MSHFGSRVFLEHHLSLTYFLLLVLGHTGAELTNATEITEPTEPKGLTWPFSGGVLTDPVHVSRVLRWSG